VIFNRISSAGSSGFWEITKRKLTSWKGRFLLRIFPVSRFLKWDCLMRLFV